MNLNAIHQARGPVGEVAVRSPLTHARSLSTGGREVRLKLETLQPTGAFKVRGAANALASLEPRQMARGVVCASTGNHGRALSHVAAQLGIPAWVCMSQLVPANKVEAIRDLGARVCIHGHSQDDAQVEVERLCQSEGLTEIPPFDHPAVIAGQGTIGLEILADWPAVDSVIVPLSGGGLIGGIALAIKSTAPRVRIIGVSMERGAAMQAALAAGHPLTVEEQPSLADSLGGGIGAHNRHTLALVQQLVDEVVLLPETAIAAAMRHLYLAEDLVTEGAGAIAAALLLDDRAVTMGRRIAVVVSGCNVDEELFRRVVAGEIPF